MLNKILTNVVVTEEGVQRIHAMLNELVKDVDATAAFLVEKSGQMLATEGEIRGLDTTAIASLVSSSFASTRAVAKLIGESFRDGIPVIMNVTDMGEADAKRLVDFAAGLVFGLHGSISRITSKVFLLTPATVDVVGAEQGESGAADSPFDGD